MGVLRHAQISRNNRLTSCSGESGAAEDLTGVWDRLASAGASPSRGSDMFSSEEELIDTEPAATVLLRGLNRFDTKKQTSVNGAMANASIKNAPRHPRELEFIFPPKTKPTACPMGMAE